MFIDPYEEAPPFEIKIVEIIFSFQILLLENNGKMNLNQKFELKNPKSNFFLDF
jgi:hypothetical protein